MQDSRIPVADGAAPGGSHQTLSAFADRLLKECKMKVHSNFLQIDKACQLKTFSFLVFTQIL